MAWFLSAVFACDESTKRTLSDMLSRDTRPDFPEDVPTGWERFHSCVERLEYPQDIIVKNNLLYVMWHDDESQASDLAALTKSAPVGVTLKVVYYVPGDPMSGDEDEDDQDGQDLNGHVLVWRDQQLVKVPRQEVERVLSSQGAGWISEENAEELLFALTALS